MNRLLITGASSGLGLELTKSYLDKSWKVTACGRDMVKLNQAFEPLIELYPDELLLKCFDLSQRQSVISSAQTEQEFDMVILNAGTCEYLDDAKNFDSQLFARVIETNVLGTAYCLEAYLPLIKMGGQLAIVSSTVTLLPLTRSQAYGASKSALDYLTKTLAIDLAKEKIDVSLIRPGFIDTPLTKKNDFPMPGMITTQQAVRYIQKGLEQRKLEINFPRLFYTLMFCLSCLPSKVWFRLGKRMARKST